MVNDVLIKAISWTLVHSVWQGFLLAFIAGIIILFTKKSAAALRYNLLAVAFVAFLVAAGLTFNYEFQSEHTETITTLNLSGQNFNFITKNVLNNDVDYESVIISYLNANSKFIVLIWFLIFSFKFFRVFANLSYIYRIRNYRTQAPSAFWTAKIAELCARIQLQKNIRLLESRLIKVPSVTGFFKPMILIPMGLLTHLPQDQMEAILLHELAHIRRKDYAINILQSFAEILFFFNPGVLWLSSLLRDERENCCDDIAVSASESKTNFVHALVSFEEYNWQHNELAMGFGGNKNHLLNRAKRIIYENNKTLNSIEKTVLSLSLIVIAVLMIACSNTKMKQNFAPETATTIAASETIAAADADAQVRDELAAQSDEEVRQADMEAMEADILTAAEDIKVAAEDIRVSGEDAKASAADVQAKAADLQARAAEMPLRQDDLNARKAQLQYVRNHVAVPEPPATPQPPVVRTVVSRTQTDQSHTVEKAVVNNHTVSRRTGVTGEDLPPSINSDRLTKAIIGDLLAENVIINTNNLSFKLSNSDLIVNGVTQPEDKFRKIRDKHMKSKARIYSICYNYEVCSTQTLTN